MEGTEFKSVLHVKETQVIQIVVGDSLESRNQSQRARTRNLDLYPARCRESWKITETTVFCILENKSVFLELEAGIREREILMGEERKSTTGSCGHFIFYL